MESLCGRTDKNAFTDVSVYTHRFTGDGEPGWSTDELEPADMPRALGSCDGRMTSVADSALLGGQNPDLKQCLIQ